MNKFSKNYLQSYLLREDGFIKKNDLKLNITVFNDLYDNMEKDAELYNDELEIEAWYIDELYDKCEHDDYEVDTDEEVRPGYDGEPIHTEYKFAICKYCGKISNPDSNGEFSEWRTND